MTEHEFGASGRGPFAELQGALSELLDQVSEFAFGSIGEGRFPRYELRVEDEGYRAVFDVPGMRREDIEVTVTERSLTVSGERRQAAAPEGARAIRTERWFGGFERSVDLPGEVDTQHVVAQLREGVLEVQLPVHSRPRGRRIEIETD